MSTSPSVQRGAGLLAALLRPASYITRRVETVRFTDDGQARRHISVDLDLSALEILFPDSDVPLLVPLTLLKKSPLALLDVRAADASSLPVFNTQDNGYLAYCALYEHARIVLGINTRTPLEESLAALLEDIACLPRAAARNALAAVVDGGDVHRVTLAADEVFRKMAGDLADNFVLITLLRRATIEGSDRSVVKFSYASALESGAKGKYSSPNRLVFAAEGEFVLPVPSVSDSRSFHIQLVPPPGLQVRAMKLYVGEGEPNDDSRRGHEVAGSHTGYVGSVNVTNQQPGRHGRLCVGLCATSRGTVPAALLASVLAAALLSGIAFMSTEQMSRLQQDTEAALVILLAIPGIISTYLARPGELNIVGRLLSGVRARLLVCAAGLFGAGVLIVLDITGTVYRVIAGLLFSLTLLCCVSLFTTWLRCRSASDW